MAGGLEQRSSHKPQSRNVQDVTEGWLPATEEEAESPFCSCGEESEETELRHVPVAPVRHFLGQGTEVRKAQIAQEPQKRRACMLPGTL